MAQPDFTDPKFWIDLRKQTSLDGRVGVEECSFWCQEALALLSEYGKHGFRKIEGGVPTKMIGKYGLYVNWHRVLARNDPEGIFIADGTAGQVQKEFPLGRYSYLDDTPRPLLLFYEDAVKRARFIPRKNRSSG